METHIKFPTIIILFFCIFMIVVLRADAVNIEDGGYHLIGNSMYQNEFVRLDYNIINTPGTHLELIEGGAIGEIHAYHNSLIILNGGTIGNRLYLHDKSTGIINSGIVVGVWTGYEGSLAIFNGTVRADIESMGNAMVSIYGGVIEGKVEAWDDCTTEIYGGSIGKPLQVFGDGMIYLHGSEFMVGNHTLNYGDSLRNYGTFNGNSISGTITGTLKDGSSLNNIFSIYPAGTADIIIIPEPATLCLLGLGGLLIRRK